MLAAIIALVSSAISEAPEIISDIELLISAAKGTPSYQAYVARVKAMQAQLELIK